jgi:hypothetical protein
VKRSTTRSAPPPSGRKPSTIPLRRRRPGAPGNPPLDAPKTRRPKPPRRSAQRPAPKSALKLPKAPAAPKRQVGRIIDEDESSLLDLIDNLLSKGVMLNADLILALADVDLVYVRLSALLCAADRVLPHRAPR